MHAERLRLEPNNVANYVRTSAARYTSLNRLDEAEAVYKQAEERKLESETLLANRYQLAFLKGDAARWRSWSRLRWESRARKTYCWPRKRIPRVGTAS